MYGIKNVSKDCVFSYLAKNTEVYAFDYRSYDVTSLNYETINDIHDMLENDNIVCFVVEKEKESK